MFSQSIYHCTRLWTFRKWSTEFRLDSVSIDRLSDRFGINFRNSHPDLNIPSKKFRRTECKTSLLNARKSTVYIDRARGRRLRATESRTQKSSNSLIRFRCSNSCFLLETCIAGQERLLLAKWHPKPRKKRRNGGFSTPLTCRKVVRSIAAVRQRPKTPRNWRCSFAFFESFLWHFNKKQRAEMIFRLSWLVSCKKQENGSGKQRSLHAPLKRKNGNIFGQILRNSRKCVKTWVIEKLMFIDHKNASVFFQAVSGMSSWSFSYRWTRQYQWEKNSY